MELNCPECMGALATTADGTARCTVHGGVYRILFQRQPAVVPAENPAGAVEPAGVRAPAGMCCVQHPTVPATNQCQLCGAYMCATCDFALPGGMHLCPVCATKPRTELSARRRQSRLWSFALAIWCTLGMAGLFGGAFAGMARSLANAQVFGSLLTLGILVPAIVGLSLGLGAIDRRLVNPPSLWVATIWNGLIVAAFLLLTLIGLMRH